MTWALTHNILDDYLLDDPQFAIESMLWACKTNGAAVSEEEIRILMAIATKHFKIYTQMYSMKKCVVCSDPAHMQIKDSNDYYCKSCAQDCFRPWTFW